MWIAEEALEAPLPSEWTEHFDSSDRVYYYNETTKGTSLTHPLENLYRDAYKTIVHFRGAMSPQDRVDELLKLQQECQQMEREMEQMEREMEREVQKQEELTAAFTESFKV